MLPWIVAAFAGLLVFLIVRRKVALWRKIVFAGPFAVVFAVALLCCGLNSTVTATLAGQAVMEGFLDLRLPPWLRRLVTRAIAIIPAAGVTLLYGSQAMGELLILTQVVLAIPFLFTGSLLLESFFGIPGLGGVTVDAIQANDFATLRTMVFIYSLLFVIGQIATDLSYGLVDPRVRFE